MLFFLSFSSINWLLCFPFSQMNVEVDLSSLLPFLMIKIGTEILIGKIIGLLDQRILIRLQIIC